ncbi:uncharacterized protein LOC136031391 [Artemia franciscana]|uniref:uncharacterized protein LOC136031391 n=1 Tax=Artemia franciscana TaxID=6661 RepID=UPI0032DA80BE
MINGTSRIVLMALLITIVLIFSEQINSERTGELRLRRGGFKTLGLATARGFGKRSDSTPNEIEHRQRSDIWLAEMQESPTENVKVTTGMIGEIIDTNDDGFISRKELQQLCSL